MTKRQQEAQYNWGLLNTVKIVRRHNDVIRLIARGMMEGRSVAELVAIIETSLQGYEV